MPIVLGERYQHRLTGLECTVTRYHGERQRADVRLDDGREVQEVPFHDLFDLPRPLPPESGPLPIQTPGPDDAPQQDLGEDEGRDAEADHRAGMPPPRRRA